MKNHYLRGQAHRDATTRAALTYAHQQCVQAHETLREARGPKPRPSNLLDARAFFYARMQNLDGCARLERAPSNLKDTIRGELLGLPPVPRG